MSLNNRFLPSHAPGAVAVYSLDFSAILPPGVGIASGALSIATNVVPPAPSSDFTVGPVTVNGRRLYAQLSGGVSATDYRLTFTANDSVGGVWPRTALLLCAATS